MHISFRTLAERHLVYAYALVILLHGSYVGWLAAQWRKSTHI